MKQVGTYQRKKNYFTKSQATLPVAHPKQQFLSIIKAKKEYQSLIKKQLDALEMYQNQEKGQVSKFQRQIQTKEAIVRPFFVQQTIKQEKSQEEFRMCFKSLQHVKITKEFQTFIKNVKILQVKSRNMMGAKYFYENSQRKKCMQLWVEIWQKSKLERQQRIKYEKERQRLQMDKQAQLMRIRQEQLIKIEYERVRQQEQKYKAMLNERAKHLQIVQLQLKNENVKVRLEKKKTQQLMQQMQRKKSEYIKWQQQIADKQQILNKKQQQINLKIVSNVFSASELHLDSQLVHQSTPSIQSQPKNAIFSPLQAKEQKSEEDFRVCAQKLQLIKRQREFIKFINKIKIAKEVKEKMLSASQFHRNYLVEKYMTQWIERSKNIKRQIQQQKRLEKERHLKQLQEKMQILIMKQEQTRKQDEKAKAILSERAKQLQKMSIQLKQNNQRLNQEMKKTLMMMSEMERKRVDLAKQEAEIILRKQSLIKKQVQINEVMLTKLIQYRSNQKKVEQTSFERQLQYKNDIITKATEQQKQEQSEKHLIVHCKRLYNIKRHKTFNEFVNKLRQFKLTQQKYIKAANLYEHSLQKRYISKLFYALKTSKMERQQVIRVQIQKETEIQNEKERERERERQREREREMQMERQRQRQIQKQMQKQRQRQRYIQKQKERQRQKQRERKMQIEKQKDLQRERDKRIESATKHQQQVRKREQKRQKIEQQRIRYEDEQIRLELHEKVMNLQIAQQNLRNDNEKLRQQRNKSQQLIQQMEKRQNQLAKKQYEMAIQQQLTSKHSAFRFFQINTSFLTSPHISNKSHIQQSQFSSPQSERHQWNSPLNNISQANHNQPEQQNNQYFEARYGYSPQKYSKGLICGQSPHQSKGQDSNLQQLLGYQQMQQHESDEIEQRHIELDPLDQQLKQSKEIYSQEQSAQIQNYMQDRYNRSLKRKVFKGLTSNNQQKYFFNLRAKCFNGLKIYYHQKKMLRQYLQLQQQASSQGYSYYPTTLQQKLQFQQLING